ncbi:MAG: Shikimate kinase 1 [Alphaproteobacteria bacterium MarineAlpha5_Bin11]|nr:hypothetical protein [Pelagibacteraceae bacterium]PPR44523.1 MAG: Shikimate kinase 1 [Alphaproteobacteria bacterium MarineAlpha5_Bin11]PPR50325.1 MAG: Shikimate kinase 1 [Alphaproteobacteria bacterium MarineAlpha5_Bin10]|tara:strand:- start:13873 stop:14442 length:570 start_codon:yes stop_codon:yes gene_type:complete
MTNLSEKFKKIHIKKIALIGHMGSGKSSVGRKLAKKINWDFYDTDAEIERECKISIKEIFEKYDEKYFRKIEEKVISKLFLKDKSVFSLGGGSILSHNTRKIMKKNCISIFLKVDIDTLIKRLTRNKNRPLLINTNIKKKLKSLNAQRLPIYESADVIITNSKNINNTLEMIIDKILKSYNLNKNVKKN